MDGYVLAPGLETGQEPVQLISAWCWSSLGPCLHDSVLSEPCQLMCRKDQSQVSSSPPLPPNMKSDWSLSFPLAIALWSLCCCIRLSPASCPCPLFLKARSCCLLQHGLPGVPSPGKHCP